MRVMVEKILAQYGTDMVVTGSASSKTVRGFFRAVNSKSWQSMESEATLLGEISRGQYAYIGPMSAGVREGDTLTLGDFAGFGRHDASLLCMIKPLRCRKRA